MRVCGGGRLRARTAGTRHHGRKALFSTGANILVAEADTGKADKGLEQNV